MYPTKLRFVTVTSPLRKFMAWQIWPFMCHHHKDISLLCNTCSQQSCLPSSTHSCGYPSPRGSSDALGSQREADTSDGSCRLLTAGRPQETRHIPALLALSFINMYTYTDNCMSSQSHMYPRLHTQTHRYFWTLRQSHSCGNREATSEFLHQVTVNQTADVQNQTLARSANL